MIGVDEARALVRKEARPVTGVETLPLAEACGRVLAGPVRADRDDPPVDRSMMDGYALRAAEAPGRLVVTGRIAAGAAELPEVAPGCAVWINTGAPLPPGADAVVPVEQTRGELEVAVPLERGANVLARGSLARAGDVVAEGLLTPGRVAVCAAHGADPLELLRRPKAAVLSTGTELQAEPGRHEIRNSNGPLLRSLLARSCEVTDVGVAGDQPEQLEAALKRGLAADLLVTTGGVSKGELDLVRPALERLGVEVLFHGVSLQPGKPVLFGRAQDCAVFALPGNPVSAMVCADLFVLPYAAARAGRGFDEALTAATGRLSAPAKASPKRRRVFPCILREGVVEPLPWRSSADLYTLTRGNAYMVLEAGRDLEQGEEIGCLIPER